MIYYGLMKRLIFTTLQMTRLYIAVRNLSTKGSTSETGNSSEVVQIQPKDGKT